MGNGTTSSLHHKTAKLLAKVKLTLTKRTVDALKPDDKPWIAWDDKLTSFGGRVHPSGAKSFLVNYRAGNGGRKAPNKRVVVGRAGRVAPDQARRLVWCLTNTLVNLRGHFGCRQGAMTCRGGFQTRPCGVYHARKSNAADGQKDPQIRKRICGTPH